MAGRHDGVRRRHGVVGQDELVGVRGPGGVVAGELEHGRRGVGRDHLMAGVDEVAGEEPAAAPELQHDTASLPHRPQEGEDPRRAGMGMESEAQMVDERQVLTVVGVGR